MEEGKRGMEEKKDGRSTERHQDSVKTECIRKGVSGGEVMENVGLIQEKNPQVQITVCCVSFCSDDRLRLRSLPCTTTINPKGATVKLRERWGGWGGGGGCWWLMGQSNQSRQRKQKGGR